ncbi:MAG: sensor histidine kinase [Halorhabdus sp.]
MARPTVLYYGPDATALADDWNDSSRPFELIGVDRSAERPTEVRSVDGVILDVDGDALEPLVEWRDDVAGSAPTVLVTTGEPNDTVVVTTQIDSHLAVSADCDRATLLETLSSLLDSLIGSRREQSMLDSLLANLPMSVYFKDNEGRHLAVSGALIEMIGPPYVENEEGKRHHCPADVLGKSDFDLYDDELAAETFADDRTVAATGDPIEDSVEDSYDERGRGTLVRTSKAPWYTRHGDVGGVVGVTQDITERKHFEYQLERQHSRLRRLTTMVSHDIRNPLAAAVGRFELARETGDSAHYDAIDRSLQRIETLVADVLDVTRQGEPVTDTEHLHVATVVRDVWASLDTTTAELRTPTTETIVAEPDRFRTLLEHLVVNALEHGRTDGPITITVGDLETGDGFFVADDGVGIPPAERDSVFEGLSAADSAGVGLNTVAAIAGAHNWTVTLTDSADGGVRVEFRGVRLIGV